MNKTLKDITLIDYLNKYPNSQNKSHIILINEKITNVAELITYLKNNPENYTPEFKKIIKNALITLDEINHLENNNKIYNIIPQIYTPEFLAFQKSCDKTTLANALPMFSLFSTDYLSIELKDYNIYLIKYLLNHYNFKGENALVASLKSLGPKKLLKLLESLNFYQDQVLRLYKENNIINNPIFFHNRQEKLKIINTEITNIVNYLFNYDNFIWGSLSMRQKDDIYNAISRHKNTTHKALANLIKILTDYTTLTELNTKTPQCLNRFIKKN